MRKFKLYKKIVALTLASTLALCGCSNTKENNENQNTVYLTIGNGTIKLDINEYKRWDESLTIIRLEDGTILRVHPSDITLLENQNDNLNVSNVLSLTDFDIEDNYNELDESDKAIIQIGNEMIELDIASYERWSESVTELILKDGRIIKVHPMNLILYNSNSVIMDEIESFVLKK